MPPTDNPSTGFLIHLFQRSVKNRSQICGIGRLTNGQTFALIDECTAPNFYIRASEADRAQPYIGSQAQLQPTQLTTMDGEATSQIYCPNTTVQRRLADRIADRGLRTYEADLSYRHQWLIQHNIRAGIHLDGPWTQGSEVDRIYTNPTLKAADWEPHLAVLSLDIETDRSASQVYAVSLVGTGPQPDHIFEEIHLVGPSTAADPPQVHCHDDEATLLMALAQRIRAVDPDVLTGWNVIDFDFRVLQERFVALGVPFVLGRSREASHYRPSSTWGRSQATIHGRQMIDALHLVRASLQPYDDFRLGTVAQAVLQRGKTLHPDDQEDMPERIEQAYRHDRAAFAEYCLEDARLVRDILATTGLMDLTLRRSLLTGLPLERAWGSVGAFDLLYIDQLRQRGLVAPSVGVDRKDGHGAPGGLVMEPNAGLYNHIFVFDFKSLYPSIMRTFNIDPLAYIQGQQKGDDQTLITAPNGARFSRDKGILPELIERFWAQREAAKTQGDPLAAFAYKIVMNSFYGVLATGACRFADDKLAGAITELGHYILRWTRSFLESLGCQVLYGDTDSVFVDAHLPADIDAPTARQQGRQLGQQVNKALADHLQEQYKVEYRLELEFEKYYRRFLVPKMRGGERGRAKGYAGLRVDADRTFVEIVGMEAVRRDWTDLAHQLQRQLLDLLFADAATEALEECIGAWVSAVYAGQKDELLVYRKGLRKKVESYQRNIPPHVRAARLLPKPSGVIHYLITRDGPQPASCRTAPIDYEHYVRKQIEPIVSTIAQATDIDVAAAVRGEPHLFRLPKPVPSA